MVDILHVSSTNDRDYMGYSHFLQPAKKWPKKTRETSSTRGDHAPHPFCGPPCVHRRTSARWVWNLAALGWKPMAIFMRHH